MGRIAQALGAGGDLAGRVIVVSAGARRSRSTPCAS